MEPMIIRELAPGDEAQICALWQEVFGYAEPRNDPARVLAEKLRWDARGAAVEAPGLLVAVDAPRIVGTLMFGYDGHRGWLYRMAVASRARRRGVGRQLVAAAERRLAALGCPKVNLQLHAHNAAGARFWAALGYAREPRIDMGKEL